MNEWAIVTHPSGDIRFMKMKDGTYVFQHRDHTKVWSKQQKTSSKNFEAYIGEVIKNNPSATLFPDYNSQRDYFLKKSDPNFNAEVIAKAPILAEKIQASNRLSNVPAKNKTQTTNAQVNKAPVPVNKLNTYKKLEDPNMKFYYVYKDGILTHKYAKNANGKYVVFPVDNNGNVTSMAPQEWTQEEFVKLMEVSYKNSNTVTDNGELHAVITNKIAAERNEPSPFNDKANAIVRREPFLPNNSQNEYVVPNTADADLNTAVRPIKGFNSKPTSIQEPNESGYDEWKNNDINAINTRPITGFDGKSTSVQEPNEGGYEEWKNAQLEPRQAQNVYKPFNLQDYVTSPAPETVPFDSNAKVVQPKSDVAEVTPNVYKPFDLQDYVTKPTTKPETVPFDSNMKVVEPAKPNETTPPDNTSTATPADNTPADNAVSPEDVVDVETDEKPFTPAESDAQLRTSSPWRDMRGTRNVQTREVPFNTAKFSYYGNEADHVIANPLRGVFDAGRKFGKNVSNFFSSGENNNRQNRREIGNESDYNDESSNPEQAPRNNKDFIKGIAKDMVYNDGNYGKTYRPETVKEARQLKKEVRNAVNEKAREERQAARDANKLERIYSKTDKILGRDYEAEQRASLEGFDGGKGLEKGRDNVVMKSFANSANRIYNAFDNKKQEGGYIVAKSGIHINPANKGKFTESANRADMGVQEFASHVLANKDDYSSTQVKRANFAHNAASWKRENGGSIVLPNDKGSNAYTWNNKSYQLDPSTSNLRSANYDDLATDDPSAVLYNTSSPESEPQLKNSAFGKSILTPQENPFGLSQNPLGYKFDGSDRFNKYRMKDTDPSSTVAAVTGSPSSVYGNNSNIVSTANALQNQLIKNRPSLGTKYDSFGNTVGYVNDGTAPAKEADKKDIPASLYDPTRLHIYGNIMQHNANMLPVMYNTAKSLFDKPEVQNPIYNKQDVAVAQGLRRNMIAPNMNPIVDNRAAMNMAIRGNARGSGQILNAMQANYNNAAKTMNEEAYRTNNANVAQMNNYLQKLGEIGDNRRQVDTLVDEKNRQHRLAFDKFQRDALESGEKALINKGQMHNQEFADEISMQNYLNQIAKDYEYVKGPNGMPYVKFKDKKTGETKVMSAKMMKDNIDRMHQTNDNNNAKDAAASNAQAAETNRRIAELEAQNKQLQQGTPDHVVLQEHAKKNWELDQKNKELQRQLDALKASQAPAPAPTGKKQSGGFVYKRRIF